MGLNIESSSKSPWMQLVKFESFYSRRLSDYGAFILRISLGSIFLAHASLKLFVFTLPGTVSFFESHGFPGWAAYPVIAGEIIGGLFLILGFATRLAAIWLLPIMLGAFLSHYPNGWLFAAKGGGWEYIALLILGLVAQAFYGSGAYSLTSLIFPVKRNEAPQEFN